MPYDYTAQLSELLGKTLTEFTIDHMNDEVRITTSEGKKYKLYHSQDCCEYVRITDVTGDPQDMVGPRSPVTLAEESTNTNDSSSESGTWTFYRFATRKGYLDLRWLGESNGYYSESVSFVEIR